MPLIPRKRLLSREPEVKRYLFGYLLNVVRVFGSTRMNEQLSGVVRRSIAILDVLRSHDDGPGIGLADAQAAPDFLILLPGHLCLPEPPAGPPPFSASNSRGGSSSEMSADQPYEAAQVASRAVTPLDDPWASRATATTRGSSVEPSAVMSRVRRSGRGRKPRVAGLEGASQSTVAARIQGALQSDSTPPGGGACELLGGGLGRVFGGVSSVGGDDVADRRCSGRRSACRHPGRPARSSFVSPRPTARTPEPALPVYVRTDPARPSAVGMPPGTAVSTSALWTPPPRQEDKCPRNRINSIVIAPPKSG